jgi:hypothetical protein
MEMRAQMSQQDLALIHVGMPASGHADRGGRSFAGSVWQVAPVIDPQSARAKCGSPFPMTRDPPGRLRRGQDRGRRDDRAAAAAERGAERRQGQLRLCHQRQERGRAARDQDRQRRRQGVTIAEGLSGQERSCCRPGRSSIRAEGRPKRKPRADANGKLKTMNFRNISSWCIRNPVPPIVLFVGLMLAGFIAFMRMEVNNNPDIDFPAAIVNIVPAGRGADRDGNPGHAAGRGGGPRRDRRRRDQQHGPRRQQQHLRQFVLGTPTDRAVNDVRDAIARSAATCPTASSSRRSRAVDIEATRSCSSRRDHRHDARAAELVRRQYVSQAAARRRGHRRGHARRRRRPHHPRHPRSGRAAGAGHHRRAGQPAASPDQPQRPGGRAEIAGSEQSVRVLGNARDAYELSQTQITCPAAAGCGWPTSARSRIPIPSSAPSPR